MRKMTEAEVRVANGGAYIMECYCCGWWLKTLTTWGWRRCPNCGGQFFKKVRKI